MKEIIENEDVLDDPLEINEDFYEHYHVITDKKQEPLRIDKFLMNRIENISRTKIQNAA